MFDESLFKYDPSTHTATYDGLPIPSVTQLVDILYPYGDDVPENRLKNAGERGTEIHGLIETLNTYFDSPLSYEHNLQEVINVAATLSNKSGRKELIDYVSILSAYKLKPFDFENTIFVLDENGDIVCYGHYDCTMLATQDITINGVNLFREGLLYLIDYKTTSLFDKKKVALQESIYALGYEQCSKNLITGIFGLWLRDGAKIISLERKDNQYILNLCKELRGIWNEHQR